MNLFTLINLIRWKKPIITIWEQKWFVAIMSILSTIGVKIYNLIQTDWDLVAILTFFYIIDFYLGIQKSKRHNIPINSLSARQSIVKGIEFLVFLGGLVLISNGFKKYATPEHSIVLEYLGFIVKDIDIIGFFGIIWVEFRSIVENMTDKEGGIKEVYTQIKNIVKNKKNK